MVSGHVVKSDVTVAGVKVGSLDVGAVATAALQLNLPADGIIGLGFPAIAADRTESFLEGLQRSEPTQSRTFSFSFSRHEKEQGYVLFGPPPLDTFTTATTLAAVPVIAASYWTIGLHSVATLPAREVSFRNEPAPDFLQAPLDPADAGTPAVAAIVDSGTSFIGLPLHAAEAFFRAVTDTFDCRNLPLETASYKECDCTTLGVDRFPTLRFGLWAVNHSVVVDVSPHDYVQVYYVGLIRTCTPAVVALDRGKYVPATSVHVAVAAGIPPHVSVAAAEALDRDDVAILGTPFFRAAYIAFEPDTPDGPRIAVGPSARAPAAVPQPLPMHPSVLAFVLLAVCVALAVMWCAAHIQGLLEKDRARGKAAPSQSEQAIAA